MLTTIYRIEGSDGRGLYSSTKLRKTVNLLNLYDDYRHPSPRDESGELGETYRAQRFRSSHLFGFDSLDQLNRWVNKNERWALSNAGAKLAKYQVEDDRVLRGSRQVAFNKYGAIKLEITPLFVRS